MTGFTLTNDSLYKIEQCSYFTGGECFEYTTLYNVGKSELKEIGYDIFGNVVAYGFVFFLLWSIISFIFYLLFPKKGNRNIKTKTN